MTASSSWLLAAPTLTRRETRRPSQWRSTVALAAREGWLIVRHPLHLAGVGLALYAVLQIPAHMDSRAAYFDYPNAVIMYEGVLTFFAAHLCATRPARSRAAGWLDATVTCRASRTTAMCLATLAPFAVACLLLAVLDPVIAVRAARSSDPGTLRLLGSAICVLGAGLLAVAVSRWLRFLGAGVVVMVALVAACAWIGQRDNHELLQPLIDWATWEGTTANGPFIGVKPGSPGWHLLYLSGWTTLALCAALLAHRRWRYPVLLAAAGAAVLTVVAGFAQLP
jgi:hypothetical protein